jgi:alpha-tubulin suppressor-like RCC1 family protein
VTPPAAPAVTPVAVSGGHRWRTIAVGTYGVCGTTTAGQTLCWAENAWGVLGGEGSSDVPRPVPGDPGLAFVARGAMHSCGLTTDGRAYCWGNNARGQVGNPAAADLCTRGGATQRCSRSALPVPTELRFRAIYPGLQHTCALTLDDRVYCWGENSLGELGDGTATDEPLPTLMAGGAAFRELRVGFGSSCGVTRQDAVLCWGSHAANLGAATEQCRVEFDGQIGFSACTKSPTPVSSGGLSFASIEMGNDVCGISGGIAYCMGNNLRGSLGDGTEQSRLSPVRVARQP